jgi:alcohol dehydrogenase
MAELVAPQGKLCSVVRNEAPLAIELLFAKSVTLVFEMMFTRSLFETPDMIEQHHLLGRVSALIDAGVIVGTANAPGGTINAANLARAHAMLEARRTIGKIVLCGF